MSNATFEQLDADALRDVAGGARRPKSHGAMSAIAKALAGPNGVYRGSPFAANGSILEPLAKAPSRPLQFAPNGSVLEPLALPR